MRLDRLDLLRYGKFTDFSLDFGQYQPDKPDMHIVFGPNEAGKTTLMAAYLDFLFGFERAPKPAYNFQHANTALKIGALLTLGDEKLEYRRVKKNKDSLIDTQDQPANDGLLLQQLAGLSKNSYENMFSLNDESLEKGGESILASKGDLGKLLYSATTGVAQLSDALMRMRTETELFYDKKKRKYELAALKEKLKKIGDERKAIDTEANAYSRLVQHREDVDAKYTALGKQHDNLKQQIKKLQLNKTAHPRLKSLERLQADMLPLTDLPDTSVLWIDEVKQLKNSSIEIDTTEQVLTNKITTLDDVINAISLDESAIAANDQWQQIISERENYLVAHNNLPELQQQDRLNATAVANCLQQLDRSKIAQPESLLLSATNKAQIRELISQQPSLLSQQDSALKELAAAEEQSNEHYERFIQQGGSSDAAASTEVLNRGSVEIDDLALSIAAFNNNELLTRVKASQQQRLNFQDELHTKLVALSPWSGDANALQIIAVPHSSELQSLQRRLEDIASQINDANIAYKALKEKLADIHSQQQSFNATGIVDDAESVRLRKLREEHWQEHRKALDANTADVFEQAMRADDTSQATRLQYAESLAHLSQLTRDATNTGNAVARAETSLATLHAEQQKLHTELEQLVKSISPLLNSNMQIPAIESWLELRADALNVLQQKTNAERELTSIEEQAADACKTVSAGLAHAGITNTLSSDSKHHADKLTGLLKIANSAIKRETALAGLKEQLSTSQRQLNTRKNTLKSAQTALSEWTSSWQHACSDCWFGSVDTTVNPITVEGILAQLQILEQQLDNQAVLEQKVEHNQKIVAAFGQSLKTLSDNLSIDCEQVPFEQQYQALLTRMDTAVNMQKSLKDAQAQKDELLEQLNSNQQKRSVIEAAITSKSTHFAVNTIDEVELKLQDVVKKQELQQRIEHEKNELLGMLEVPSLSDAVSLLSDYNSDAAQMEISEIERTTNDLELTLREAHTACEDARRAVEHVGGDEAVALLNEQRANVLLEIEDKITRFLQQHLALNAADAALKIYRDNHRSSMMTKASDAFARISQGRYTRLETSQDGTSEQLIAIEKDGRSKLSSELSKGTRFQLYLALRIAGFHEYALSRPAVPFIADDIMETSDDDRARQTFEVLGEMASVGQVIYLTHHEHLCDIAQQAVPGCRIHRLPTATSNNV